MYDIIIYGATGFTGRFATHYLTRTGIARHYRIAIAGRNRQKLQRLQAECELPPAIIVADSSQPETIATMVQQTKVVLSLAGPFALYGEPVIAACAQYGKDYVDITGETPFIRSMIQRYEALAQQTGARLLPFSGFDSIPAELSVYLALTTARKHDIALEELCLYYQLQGGFNEGTLATALHLAEQADSTLSDPNCLLPDVSWPRQPIARLRPQFEPSLARWSAPFFMAPINRAVVQRAAWLRRQTGTGTAPFRYEERWLMGARYGFVRAWLTTACLWGFYALTRFPLGRQLLRYFGPQPGQGPAQAVCHQGFFKGTLIGRSQGQARIRLTLAGQGDPGNTITVALAAETARLAAEGAYETPRTGFISPTLAFGDALPARLQAAGFRITSELVLDRAHGV